MPDNSSYLEDFQSNGYTVMGHYSLSPRIEKLRLLFQEDYQPLFSNDAHYNRNIIKAFAASPQVAEFFCCRVILRFLSTLRIYKPVRCGPIVSHYTSHDATGQSYGLPFHQDWPSMASSLNSLIVWMTLKPITSESQHGIAVSPLRVEHNLLPGVQSERGYILEDQDLPSLNVLLGDDSLLFMSSFTPHKTFVSPSDPNWKLSLSQRYDDLSCKDWMSRGYETAYKTTVDRYAYLR